MSDFIELSLEDIAAIGTEQPKAKRTTKSKVDTSVRSHENWFKLVMTFDVCENPNCIDTRPKRVEGKAMVAVVNKKAMCRPCFLSGFNNE